jgi:hypothetical protein
MKASMRVDAFMRGGCNILGTKHRVHFSWNSARYATIRQLQRSELGQVAPVVDRLV